MPINYLEIGIEGGRDYKNGKRKHWFEMEMINILIIMMILQVYASKIDPMYTLNMCSSLDFNYTPKLREIFYLS